MLRKANLNIEPTDIRAVLISSYNSQQENRKAHRPKCQITPLTLNDGSPWELDRHGVKVACFVQPALTFSPRRFCRNIQKHYHSTPPL